MPNDDDPPPPRRRWVRPLLVGGFLVAVVGASLAQRGRFAGTPRVEFVPVTSVPSTTAPSSVPTVAGGSGAFFPEANSTGVTDNVSLVDAPEKGEWLVTDSVEGVTFTGTIRIGAPDVTLRNVRIIADRGLAGIDNRDNHPGLVVEWVEVVCVATDPTVAAAILGSASVRRSDVAGCVDGIVAGPGSTIVENYIHDLLPGGRDFSEGVFVERADRVTVRGNTILGRDDGTKRFNAAVYVGDGAGPVDGVVVAGNYVDGFGVTLQLNGAGVTGSEIVDNVIGQGHLYGPFLFANGAERTANGNRAAGNRRPDGTPLDG